MIALIFNLALFVLLIIVIISEFKDKRKTNRLLRQERSKDDKFRERVINLLQPDGFYLVVVYWYDTKDFTYVYTYAKNGIDAFLDSEETANKKVGGTDMYGYRNKKFSIVNVKFLGHD